MIQSITLTNFKCFERQDIVLKPLTLLAGLNSSGKSTIIQALLLLRQSYLENLLPNAGLTLNGKLAQLGTAKDVLAAAREGAIMAGLLGPSRDELMAVIGPSASGGGHIALRNRSCWNLALRDLSELRPWSGSQVTACVGGSDGAEFTTLRSCRRYSV